MSAVAKAVAEELSEIDTSNWTFIRTVKYAGKSSDIYKEGRQCRKCGVLKPFDEFHPKLNGIGERCSHCKSCKLIATYKLMDKHPEGRKGYGRDAHQRNKAKWDAEYLGGSKARNRDAHQRNKAKWDAEYPDGHKGHNRDTHQRNKAKQDANFPGGSVAWNKAASLRQKIKLDAEFPGGSKAYKREKTDITIANNPDKYNPEYYAEKRRIQLEKDPDYYIRWHQNRPDVSLAKEFLNPLQLIGLVPIFKICCIPECTNTARLERHHRNHRHPEDVLTVCPKHHSQLNQHEYATQRGVDYQEDWLFDVHRWTQPHTYEKPTLQVAWNVMRKIFGYISKEFPEDVPKEFSKKSEKWKIKYLQRITANAYQRVLRNLFIGWSGCVITGETNPKKLELQHECYDTPRDLMNVVELRKDIHKSLPKKTDYALAKYMEHHGLDYYIDTRTEFQRFDMESEFKRAT